MDGLYNDIEEITGFECCFCKQDIEENSIDPCDITIVINAVRIKKNKPDNCSQQFYSHIECIREKLHEDIRGYLVIDSCTDND